MYWRHSERKQLKQEAKTVVRKFLWKLDRVTNVACFESTFSNSFIDIVLHYTSKAGNPKQHPIALIVDAPKRHGVFVETYATGQGRDGCYLARAGSLFMTKADTLFMVTGHIVYTVPTQAFIEWMDKESETFQAETAIEYVNGRRLNRHGLFIPFQRLRQAHFKKQLRVSAYHLIDNPNSETEIDFMQEL